MGMARASKESARVSKSKAAPKKVVKLQTKAPNALWSKVLEKAATSMLSETEALKMGLAVATREEMAKLGLPAFNAFCLPYFGLNGKRTGFCRWRYLEDTRDDFLKLSKTSKALRYVQLPESPVEAYFPPFVDWKKVAQDPGIGVVFTEGELKAACCSMHIAPCIGLGGVYSFRSARLGQDLIPDLKEFKWEGREVVIAFDSDSIHNSMVTAARTELCKKLTQLGAMPRIAQLPDAPDGSKQGVDDLAYAEGIDAVVEVLGAAEAFEESAALHELNNEVAYVKDPGIVAVLHNSFLMNPNAFLNHAYSNRHHYERVEKSDGGFKLVKISTARAWLDWPRRFELKRVTYSPGEDRITAEGELNKWKGWGCEPRKGDISPWKELLDHLFKGFPKEREWFERWCAIPIQQPGAKMFTAAVLHGRLTGTGKSSAGYCLKGVYGVNFTEIGDNELKDPRNQWAIDKQFVLGDDVTGQEQRKHADRLKTMITQSEMRLDPKYIPSYTVPDRVNYLFTSNHPDAFFLEDDDRRFFVHEVSSQPLSNEFYECLRDWRQSPEGASALFHHLLNLDIGTQRAEDRAPKTKAKDAMIEDGLSDLGRWVRQLRDDPEAILKLGDVALAGDIWSAQDLLKLYDTEGRGRTTSGGMARELKRAGMMRVYEGMQLATCKGHLRLYAVRNPEKWEKASRSQLIAHYDATRGGQSKPKK